MRNVCPLLMISCAALAVGLLLPKPAFAFACTVYSPDGGHVLLHVRPNAKSKVVARLQPSYMVSDISGVRPRGDWIFVRWSRVQMSLAEFSRGKGDGKGWIRIAQTQGECED
jgi:hypothetical protein